MHPVLRLWIAVVLAALGPAQAASATSGGSDPAGVTAAQVAGRPEIRSALLLPVGGTELVVGERRYDGTLSITRHDDGLALVEEVDLDGYLAGIAEVPFDWPTETLKAQAVAARTYLAWTLDRGRSADAAKYDFDICATVACQVYAGVGVAAVANGRRWLDAVAATTGEILLYQGAPAQALYSSSAGSRTRPIQDIFGGEPKPYLGGIDSPEAGVTPFERWEVPLDLDVVRRILAVAGIRIGAEVGSMEVISPPVGQGTASLVIESNEGRVSIPVSTIRHRFNDIGQRLYPGLLPASRPQGGRWPQAIMSYTFAVEFVPGETRDFPDALPSEDLPASGRVTFVGEGWGHSVGMSQWGAFAMGEAGATYAEILGHYYGGLQPQQGGAAVPETVRVGLGWGEGAVTVVSTGAFELRINDVVAGVYGPGEWGFRVAGSEMAVVPPPDQAAVTAFLAGRRWPF